MAVISGYQLQPDSKGLEWKPSNSGSTASAVKSGRSYRLKLYKRYPSKEGFTERAYKAAMADCKRILTHLRTLNDRLRRADGGTGTLAFASEVLDNKSGTDQGIIEVVPFVEGARDLTSLTATDARLKLLESLAAAMVRLHSVNVRHGDLKLANALCVMHGAEPRGVLIDFDRSCMDGVVPHPDDVGGTDGYIPPELVDYKNIEDDEDEELMARLQARITGKSDIFALGMMFYLILTGDTPDIENFAYKVNLSHPAVREGYLNELIKAMIAAEPDDRPDAEMVLQTLQEKCFADNLPPFEEVWPEHEGYSYQEVTPLGRRVKRVRRAKQGDEPCYAVTFEGFAPRIYSFTMMKTKGLLVGAKGASTGRTGTGRARPSSVSAGDVVDGYRLVGPGLSPDDQSKYKLDDARMAAAGYAQIWHCVEVIGGKPMYALFKADNTCYVRSLRMLTMQRLVQLR